MLPTTLPPGGEHSGPGPTARRSHSLRVPAASRARRGFQRRRTRSMLSPEDAEVDFEDDGCGLARRVSILDSSSRPPRNSTGGSFSQRGQPLGVRRSLGRTLFKRQRDYIVDCWRAFCSSSALHGLGYVTRAHFTPAERGFWGVCIIVCIILSLVSIHIVYKRWDQAPPVLSVSSSAPIWEVPFPAVSICPANTEEAGEQAYYRDATPRVATWNRSMLLTESARPKPTAINLGFRVCYDSVGGMRDVEGCVETMKEKAPALKDVVLSASWNGIPLNLSQEVFRTIVSDGGICYTFNMLDARDIFSEDAGGKRKDALRWTLEKGYPRGFPWESVPRRTLRISPKSGLYFTMRGKNSYKIVVHAPMDVPIVGSAFHNYAFTSKEEAAVQSVRQFELTPASDEETVINVAPVQTESSDLLQFVDVEQRQCYFLNERRLRYFQVYTQRNCEMECLTNRTIATCHCAAIFMPMAKHYRVCESRACYLEVMKGNVNCSCLPSCTTLEYDTFVSHYNWKREFTREGLAVEDEWANLSRIVIKMKDTTFTMIGRTESYSQPEFLADCGGLLGLYSGFSLITLVEAFFHLVVRWWCHTFRTRRLSRLSSVKIAFY